MIDRRSFLKIMGAGVAGMGSYIRRAGSGIRSATNFGLHPFIEANPHAVFIMNTNILASNPADVIGYFNSETNSFDIQPHGEEKVTIGRLFSGSVFVPRWEGGMPIANTKIAIKPNWKGPGTAQSGRRPFSGATSPPTPDEEYFGCSTDPFFAEGIIEGLKELGIPVGNLFVREGYNPTRVTRLGWPAMAARTGIPSIKAGLDATTDLNATYTNLTEGVDYNWHQTPNGIYFARIPRHDPINTPGSFLLNLAKFKTHGMGLTLCVKNLQGATSRNVQGYCNNNNTQNLTFTKTNPGDAIAVNYERHRDEGVPHWEVGGTMGGAYYESWVTRTLDNLETFTTPQLHVVEGIIGRDGDGGNGNYWGPHPVDAPWATWAGGGKIEYSEGGINYFGTSKTFLSNFILFGINPFNVDAIGHWLGGHEPGRFGLFHIAKERGLMESFNPRNIQVYEWDEQGNAKLVQLDTLARTPLLTYYLWNRDPDPTTYTATHEPYWRMLDEYDYQNDPPVFIPPFSSVEETGLPQAVVINAAHIYDEPIEEGDWIGVFDGELCVGAGRFEGSYPMTITAWLEAQVPGGDPLPGGNPGNSMSFQIWKTSNGKYYRDINPSFTEGTGVFGEPVTAVILNLAESSQTVDLLPGRFNMMSFNVKRDNMNIASLLAGVEGLVIAKDDDGKFYVPSQEVNTIGTVDVKKGYWAYHSGEETKEVSLSGSALQPDTLWHTFSNTRWHLIGCPYNQPVGVEGTFASIAAKVTVMQNDRGMFWLPGYGVNTLGALEPGKGYQIHVNEGSNFTWPSQPVAAPKTAKAAKIHSAPVHFPFTETGQPYAVVITSSQPEIASGDEIALFDGDLCVGSAVFTGTYPFVLAAWKGSPEYEITGFTPGNEIIVKLWKSSEMKAYLLMTNESEFGSGALSELVVTDLTSVDSQFSAPGEYVLEQNHPNPFNLTTTIKYSVARTGAVTLKVYDVNGRFVRTLVEKEIPAGFHQVVWDGRNENGRVVAAGVYLVRMNSSDFRKTIKMTLLK